MTGPLVVRQSRAVSVTPEEAFDGTVPIPLPELFNRWYGPIPPIRAVTDQSGPWDAVGRTRTVHLTGGGSMREQLIEFERPRAFAYALTDVKGPLSPMVDHVEGLWTFTPDGDGTQVTWQWTVHPRSAVARPVLPVFGRLWMGYARRSLGVLAEHLEA